MHRLLILAILLGACGGVQQTSKTTQDGETCTDKLTKLVFQASTCAELQRLADAEMHNNPACWAFFAADGGGFDVCELRPKREGGADVQK